MHLVAAAGSAGCPSASQDRVPIIAEVQERILRSRMKRCLRLPRLGGVPDTGYGSGQGNRSEVRPSGESDGALPTGVVPAVVPEG